MSERSPKLSVILPNYNHAPFVGEALAAIFDQSYEPKEVIVVDDASTDDSVAVIERAIAGRSAARLIRNDRNRGVNASLNRGLSFATGEYIYGAAADDRVLPGFFERTMALAAAHPSAAVCSAFPSFFDEATGVINENDPGWGDRDRFVGPAELPRVLRGRALPGHATIIRRECLLEAGGWLEELAWFADWFLLNAAAFRHGAGLVPAPLALFRASVGSYSAAGLRDPAAQSAVLGRMLELVASPEFGDLLPQFAESRILEPWSADLTRAAAARPDVWSDALLEAFGRIFCRAARGLLCDGEAAMRRGIARLLERCGPRARRAIPALAAATNDVDLGVRAAAEAAVHVALGRAATIAGGAPARLLIRMLRSGQNGARKLLAWLRPPAAGLYRRLNRPLLARVDRLEAALARQISESRARQQALEREVAALRAALAAATAGGSGRPLDRAA